MQGAGAIGTTLSSESQLSTLTFLFTPCKAAIIDTPEES